MKRPCFLLAVSITAVCGLTERTQAQTLYGQSGLFIHPTAFTPKRHSLTFSASWFTQHIQGQRRTEWVPLGLSYGITDRLEVGVLYMDRLAETGLRRGSVGGFVRQQLVTENAGRPAITLSGSYLGSDVQLASAAMVASYHFRRGTRTALIGHAGVQWGWRADGIPASDAVSVFVGAEVPLGGGFSVLGEYGSRFAFDNKDRSALGLMWHGRQGFSVAVGYVNVGRSSDNQFFVGVGVPLGGNKQQ
jgi:hypothetical protein